MCRDSCDSFLFANIFRSFSWKISTSFGSSWELYLPLIRRIVALVPRCRLNMPLLNWSSIIDISSFWRVCMKFDRPSSEYPCLQKSNRTFLGWENRCCFWKKHMSTKERMSWDLYTDMNNFLLTKSVSEGTGTMKLFLFRSVLLAWVLTWNCLKYKNSSKMFSRRECSCFTV